MTEEEINKIIAEYMGWEYHQERWLLKKGDKFIECEPSILEYTKSLDLLIPVVEKLKTKENFIFRLCWVPGRDATIIFTPMVGQGCDKVENKHPSLALATACAEVIKDLI